MTPGQRHHHIDARLLASETVIHWQRDPYLYTYVRESVTHAAGKLESRLCPVNCELIGWAEVSRDLQKHLPRLTRRFFYLLHDDYSRLDGIDPFEKDKNGGIPTDPRSIHVAAFSLAPDGYPALRQTIRDEAAKHRDSMIAEWNSYRAHNGMPLIERKLTVFERLFRRAV